MLACRLSLQIKSEVPIVFGKGGAQFVHLHDDAAPDVGPEPWQHSACVCLYKLHKTAQIFLLLNTPSQPHHIVKPRYWPRRAGSYGRHDCILFENMHSKGPAIEERQGHRNLQSHSCSHKIVTLAMSSANLSTVDGQVATGMTDSSVPIETGRGSPLQLT